MLLSARLLRARPGAGYWRKAVAWPHR